ncbi:MAG: hypothetical protein V4647_11760 [Pseudomonadota bacterium]
MAIRMAAPSVPQIFSQARRAARAQRLTRFAVSEPEAQFLRRHAAEDVLDRLDFMRLPPCEADLHGDPAGLLADPLRQLGFTTNAIATLAEELPYPGPQRALIVSLFTLDTVNDLPGALIHLRKALAPGGLLIACLTGAGTLPTLRQVLLAADGERPAARVHPQIDNQTASALLARAGFARQVVDTHSLPVTYRSLDRLLADLRAQGLTNVLADAPPPLTRAGLDQARAAFAERADASGRVSETFELLTLTAWG